MTHIVHLKEVKTVNESCERCGYSLGFESDVCGVCLAELELEHQYEVYRLVSALNRVPSLAYSDWADINE